MKTSFYFVLWIGSYIIIDLLDIPFLNSQPFVVACIMVYLGSKLADKAFAQSINCLYNNELVRILEQIYTDNKENYYQDKRWSIYELLVIVTYFVLSILGFLFLGVKDLFCYGVFVVFTIMNLRQLFKQIKWYNYVKTNNCFGFEEDEEFQEIYKSYCESRTMEGCVTPMLLRPHCAYKIVTIVASIFSILIGVAFLCTYAPYLFTSNQATLITTSLVMYGSLALVYGVKDIIEGFKAFC